MKSFSFLQNLTTHTPFKSRNNDGDEEKNDDEKMKKDDKKMM